MSFCFKIDARIKLICVFLLTILVFLVDKLPAAVLLLTFVITFRLTSGIPFRITGFFWNLTLLAAMVIALQTLFGPGTRYIIKPLIPSSFPFLGGTGSLKWEGLTLGIVIVCRLASLMLFLPVFTETTPPHQIAAGLCAAKINYRSAFIITTAFNMIAFFREEALHIMNAQKLRGICSFENRQTSFFNGIKAYISLLIPLILVGMRKAQCSSAAMDSRAFGVYKTRTWLDKPRMKSNDFWFIFICLALFTGILFINFIF